MRPKASAIDHFVVQMEPEPAIISLDPAMKDHIRKALACTGWKVEGENGAANILGLHTSTLRARMRRLGIPFFR